MAKKKDIKRLLVSDLTSKIRFGESRHEAKLQAENRFNANLEFIYSKQTYETYKKTAVLFANYCKNNDVQCSSIYSPGACLHLSFSRS